MSWNSRGGGAFSRRELLQNCKEFWYPEGGYVSDFVEVHANVIVDQHVAHTADRLPIE